MTGDLFPRPWTSRTARVVTAPLLSFRSKSGLVCLCKAFLSSCGPKAYLADVLYHRPYIPGCLVLSGASTGVAERTAKSG